MSTSKVALAAAVTALFAALPAPAFAQSEDTAYCQALAERYTQHKRRLFRGFISDILNNNRSPIVVTPEVEAMVHCKNAPEYVIPILEQALLEAGVKLPPQQAERK